MKNPASGETASTATGNSVGSSAGFVVVLGFVCCLVLTFVIGINVEQLLLGWLYFPLHTLPLMTVDWPSVVVGFVSLLLFVLAVHSTGVWLVRSRANNRWTWRTTIASALAMSILFAAGTALVAATHQFTWLMTGRSSTSDAVRYPGLLRNARDSSQTSQTRNELQAFGLAFHNYHDIYGAFPVGGTVSHDGQLLHGWALRLGGLAGYSATGVRFEQSWSSPENARIYQCQMQCFVSPSIDGPVFDKDGFGLCHYAGNVHVMPIRQVDGKQQTQTGSFEGPLGIRLSDIKDGTANTILLGTVGQNFKPWGHPANVRDPALGINRSPDGFGGPPVWNGAYFAMCDGSVRFFSEDTDPAIMKALGTLASGDDTSFD